MGRLDNIEDVLEQKLENAYACIREIAGQSITDWGLAQGIEIDQELAEQIFAIGLQNPDTVAKAYTIWVTADALIEAFKDVDTTSIEAEGNV